MALTGISFGVFYFVITEESYLPDEEGLLLAEKDQDETRGLGSGHTIQY